MKISPKKPENPIEIAYKKAEKERAFALNLDMPGLRGFGTIPDLSAYIASPIKSNSVFESIEIEDNIVEIE